MHRISSLGRGKEILQQIAIEVSSLEADEWLFRQPFVAISSRKMEYGLLWQMKRNKDRNAEIRKKKKIERDFSYLVRKGEEKSREAAARIPKILGPSSEKEWGGQFGNCNMRNER